MKSFRLLRQFVLLWASFTVGCAEPPEPNVCAQAQLHIEACLGQRPAATVCDPTQAETVVKTECSELRRGKADGVADALCALGVFALCEAPRCDVLAPSTTCADYIDRDDCSQCDYYLCREAQSRNGCGETGYYEAFGYHYCRLYKGVVADSLSPYGQQFAYQVRRCLMVAMEVTIPLESSCAEVKAAAYASHQQCYLEAGFCRLGMVDRLAVLATISPQDIDVALALRTMADCF